MIGWIYSDPVCAGFWTGGRTSYQKFVEHTKTIVDTSNRFRVVSDVVCDGFMQFESLLDVKQAPSCRARPHKASPSFPIRGHGQPAARRGLSHKVEKSCAIRQAGAWARFTTR